MKTYHTLKVELLLGRARSWSGLADEWREHPIGARLYQRAFPAGHFAIDWQQHQVFYVDSGQWLLYNTAENLTRMAPATGMWKWCHQFGTCIS
eukprot:CAMPEP_0115730768 /NCGR_PEP_ID=MMETSP0272-20121206/84214_1 /TAXON_ID=71861 /ORGANISM="Scrippsiella trochoidea, Strain CCMP3099" /LENGTH=92 /DNA_ID=CAMNT_0003174533 /DNA_START=266 /DNA_END=541 /DNA_ORIENTATION=+